MLKNITLGQYILRDSLIHSLDPRMKIMITMLIVIGLFFIGSFWGFLVAAAYMFTIIAFSHLSWKVVIRGLKPVMFILIFTLVIHLFFTRGGVVLFELGFLRIESEGLFTGLFMAVRIMLLISLTSLLTLTTSPIQLTDGLEYLLNPFRRFGLPAHELAMMMTIALRFIPTLLEEAEKIMKAQQARGADFESGSIFRRAKSLVPLLVPLFLSAFRRADDLAMAMEARCYRGGEGRTRMKELHFLSRDWLALGFSASFIIIFIIL